MEKGFFITVMKGSVGLPMNRERRMSKIHLIHLLEASIHPRGPNAKLPKGARTPRVSSRWERWTWRMSLHGWSRGLLLLTCVMTQFCEKKFISFVYLFFFLSVHSSIRPAWTYVEMI
ncbi:hypothetical protein P170DRAFT_19458 [Aspergillus steynii IBT 23096]|uniref:Uncharacterized protein n=1 Tax=Aspergillus steynii IBT 23096 TaxID=1392250 RepID=A0A2I2GNM2_9EURO|nr:uncharacterized protein P170DRAFT_19458 [Aspergillus steynii IBT 23096]PLB54478.1 hypothetical protein P170DRAFT_19458 [Aspergillus steynii IBT 23096]